VLLPDCFNVPAVLPRLLFAVSVIAVIAIVLQPVRNRLGAPVTIEPIASMPEPAKADIIMPSVNDAIDSAREKK
jgi:hypothetical protein